MKSTSRLAPLPLLLLLAAPAALFAADPAPAKTPAAAALPGGLEKVTSVEGITEYRLPNGMRVLLFPDRSKPTATVNITYLAGSRHEGYGETGMAHLIEHMIFKGTPKHPNIPQELTAHGCRPNGTTWYDRTNYFETFISSDENLEWALDLEADRMVNCFMAKKDLDSEMTVVRNEFEMGENDPRGILTERLLSTAYLWHNYGKSTIGARADLENVPIEKLQAFYRRWYQPDNAMLVVAGKFDEAKVLALVADKFGRLPRPERKLEKTYTAEPAQDGERSVTLRRVGDTRVVGAVWHVPAGSHPDFAALDILAFILGDTPSGRLHKALVEPKKATAISSQAWQLCEPGTLQASADLRLDQDPDAALAELVKVVEETATKPPTAEEVDRARQARLRDWELTMRASERAAIEISEFAAMGDWRLLFVHRDRLKKVTPDDVKRVAAAYLRRENRTVGTFVPTKDASRVEIPAAPAVETMVAGYKGDAAIEAGEELDPTPSVLEARVVRTKTPAGLKLAVLPKKSRGGMVQVNLTFHLGDEKSLAGRARAGEMAGSMLMRGTSKHTRQQIQDEIDKLTGRVVVDGSATTAFARLEVPKQNLEKALRLVAEMMREPSFPETELELLRQEELAQLEESKSDPQQAANTVWSRQLNPWPENDPRYVATPDESIARTKAVKLDDVKAFWSDFYGAAAGEMAVVGDVDPKQVDSLVRSLFGDWKPKKPFARLANPYKAHAPLDKSVETPDKENAVLRGGMRLDMKDDDAAYPALLFGNFLTGGGFLNSRLAVRIRQKEGISYGVGSFFSASGWEKDATWGVYAIYAPQNSDRLMAAFREEIERVRKDGFTENEIAEGKKGWLQSRRVSRGQDRELAMTLAARDYLGRTLAWDAGVESKVEKLTSDEIKAAMAKYLDPAKMALVQAGDFAKAKKAAAEAPKAADPAPAKK